MKHKPKHIQKILNAQGNIPTPALHNLIKFLARVAVDQYFDELHLSEKLQPKEGLELPCHEHSLTINPQCKDN